MPPKLRVSFDKKNWAFRIERPSVKGGKTNDHQHPVARTIFGLIFLVEIIVLMVLWFFFDL
jgi:hypothetical protein